MPLSAFYYSIGPLIVLLCTAYLKSLGYFRVSRYNDNYRRYIMNIRIIENINEFFEIIIKCPKADASVMKLKKHIEAFEEKLDAIDNDKHYLISPLEVFYFESVDNRTFLYTETQVLEVRKRLYELGEILSDKDFVRTSKSQLVNINKIKLLKPELNRSITAEMINGEILFISRRYAKQIKTLLSI